MDELTDLQKQYQESLRNEELDELQKYSEEIASFKSYLSQFGIQLTDDNFRYYQTSGIIVTFPNLLGYLHETLTKDKEGLLEFKKLTQVFEHKAFINGYLYGKNFMLMANPYFRRGFHQINNFAPRFIELYWNYNKPDVDKYISLDFNSVRITNFLSS